MIILSCRFLVIEHRSLSLIIISSSHHLNHLIPSHSFLFSFTAQANLVDAAVAVVLYEDIIPYMPIPPTVAAAMADRKHTSSSQTSRANTIDSSLNSRRSPILGYRPMPNATLNHVARQLTSTHTSQPQHALALYQTLVSLQHQTGYEIPAQENSDHHTS
jgi:hypothetical protein